MKRKKAVSAAEMKEIERIADSRGVSYRQMMENAGTAAFEQMRIKWPEAQKIVIFAGKGNNGGDGFVAARLYEKAGAQVTVILCEGMPVTEDASYNFDRLTDAVKKYSLDGMGENGGIAEKEIGEADLIVDALYGTGFHGTLRESGRRAAAMINGSDVPVCALDLPSGMNADTGEIAEGAVRADLTVVFHCRKLGHEAAGAEKQCGEIVVVSIGIDEVLDDNRKE